MKQVRLRNGMVGHRVNREAPCKVCGRTSWCLHLVGGGSVCQRVASDREVVGAGWLHVGPSDAPTIEREPAKEYPPDYSGMLRTNRRYRAAIKQAHLDRLVEDTGIDERALVALGVGWDGRAYTFPMRDGDGRIIGIRKRQLDGAKWAEPGSRSGLFIAESDAMDWLLMPEGPTDSAVLVEMGFSVWGRPDAKSGHQFAVHRLVRMRHESADFHPMVVVIGDHDVAGMEGAKSFAKAISSSGTGGVRVWYPPVQGLDVREFVDLLGHRATRELFTSLFSSVEVQHHGSL